ncbi:MAG: NAD(P)/FAD-dependent oxidoreductase [Candidatus Margulisiibacteriota bacterium]|jgi:flavin-dependent dehydrogenase
MMTNFDLIIIGAGPAGLTLASELKDSSLKILILDKKKNASDVSYNTSGSFIDPAEWGLPESVLHPIYESQFFSKNELAIKRGSACIIDRQKLLIYLEKKALENSNLVIEYDAKVVNFEITNSYVKGLVYLKQNKEHSVQARLFADCSGSSALLGIKMKLAPKKTVIALGAEYVVPLKTEENTADLFIGSNFLGGYAWIFPKDSKYAIIGYGSLDKSCFNKVEAILKSMWDLKRVQDRCELNPIEKHFAIIRTGMPLKKFNKNNVIIIGDVALQANPLVGEGLRFVMDAAKMASKSVKMAIEKNNDKFLTDYSKAWVKKYYKKFKLCYFMQKLIQKISDNDHRLDRGVKKLAKISNEDFGRLLSGDLTYWFLFRIGFFSLLKKYFFNYYTYFCDFNRKNKYK